jgi:ubiquinone/menaquinone biosynthesis C-methylase UbiE
MRMGKFEKTFVNAPRHAKRAIGFAESLLQYAHPDEDKKYLEVGCGAGAVCHHVAGEYRLDVTGIDVDPEQVELAKEIAGDKPNIRFFEASAADLPFPDDEYDIVLSYMVLHHISGWPDAMKEIRRVLKPGGYYIIGDLVFPRFTAWVGQLFKKKFGVITISDFNDFFEKNGFTEVHLSKSKSHLFGSIEGVYRRSS